MFLFFYPVIKEAEGTRQFKTPSSGLKTDTVASSSQSSSQTKGKRKAKEKSNNRLDYPSNEDFG